VIALPEVVTHRYDPGVGPFPNICALAEIEPMQVLDRLRRESRPTLKPDYLIRRHSTERWLAEAAAKALGRNFEQRPAYFFLGDFSHLMDLSRPAALVVPLSTLPPDSISFTLGDSMSVAEQPGRRVYTLDEIAALFLAGHVVSGFGTSDRLGFQARFVEVQLWGRLAGFLRGCALFGMRYKSGKARVAMERLQIRVGFDREIGLGCQSVVNSLSQ
jgi:hypothetical protein